MRLWIATLSLVASIIAVPFCPAMAAHADSMGSTRMDAAMMVEQMHATAPDCCIGSPIHTTEQAISADGVVLPIPTGMLPTTAPSICLNPSEGRARVTSNHHPPNVKFESRSKSKRE